MSLLLAQAGGAYSIDYLLTVAIIIGGIWAIYNVAVAAKVPEPFRTIINIVVGCIVAIVAIRILLSFL